MPTKKKNEITSNAYKESPLRSILKTISWRIIATITTITIAYIFTKEIDKALQIGAAEVFFKLAVYYLHERAWTNISWGKNWSRRRRLKRIINERKRRDKKLFEKSDKSS